MPAARHVLCYSDASSLSTACTCSYPWMRIRRYPGMPWGEDGEKGAGQRACRVGQVCLCAARNCLCRCALHAAVSYPSVEMACSCTDHLRICVSTWNPSITSADTSCHASCVPPAQACLSSTPWWPRSGPLLRVCLPSTKLSSSNNNKNSMNGGSSLWMSAPSL